MSKNRLLVVLCWVAISLCATNLAFADDSGAKNTSQTLTGVIQSVAIGDGILIIDNRSFAVGSKPKVISTTNRYTSYRHLRSGMTVTITFQPRGDYQFPLVNTIQIIK